MFPNDFRKNDTIIYKYTLRKYITFILKTNMSKENAGLGLDKTRNNILEEIKHNDLMSQNHKKVSMALKMLNVLHFLIFFSTVSGCVSILVFVLLVSCRYCELTS